MNMNISINSFKNFIFVNGFLLSLGYFHYEFIQHFAKNTAYDFFIYFFIFTIRNYSLLNFIEFGTQNKPKISNNIVDLPKEEYKYEFHYNIASTTAVESITHIIIKNNINVSQNLCVDLLYFIPVSFFFEIIFDLFHYGGHLLLHNSYLYKYHKKHHKFKHPISIITFYQHPIDLLITNSLPLMLSVSLVPTYYFQFNLIVVYKNFIEISGHVGKKLYPTCCFTQVIWLPKMLHIELYAEEHDLHHSLNNCNYAKRFSLWDKLFGTYTPMKMKM